MACWPHAQTPLTRAGDGSSAPGLVHLSFAAAQSAEQVSLPLELVTTDAPELTVTFDHGAQVTLRSAGVRDGHARYSLPIQPPADPSVDDRVFATITAPNTPDARIEFRRSTCILETALLGGRATDILGPDTRAALYWFAWKRFRRLVGMKRFQTGRSGSAVLVFRPRLVTSTLPDGRSFSTCYREQPLPEAWGSWLLVKTGRAHRVRQEWDRFQTFLLDRLTPFLSCNEEFLAVTLAGPARQSPVRHATLISSFVGGELIRAEPLENVLRGTADAEPGLRLIDRAFAQLMPWYGPHVIDCLGHWPRMFGQNPAGSEHPVCLFHRAGNPNRFDLSRADHRAEFTRGVEWDIPFKGAKHLRDHLLGKPGQDGLLAHVMQVRARFSLTHGDLTSRNILCEGGDTWLIDFEHTGPGPTLLDFAWLEVNLRLWCLSLPPAAEGVYWAAKDLERHLLDHFHGGEASLEPVTQFARRMGADPRELHKLARCIAHVRRLALPFCLEEYADRRDYLAVLYLVTLSLVRLADENNAPAANWRALMALYWVLEETLALAFEMEPFRPEDVCDEPDLPHLLTADWIDAPGAPGRARYLLDLADGPAVLPFLAACRGIAQGGFHHLDVLDHTLLVLAFVEALLEGNDPVAGFLNPADLDRRVRESLARQGLSIPLPCLDSGVVQVHDPIVSAAREAFAEALSCNPQRVLKWCALLHDVGKPGTRAMDQCGQLHFYGHTEYGLQLVGDLLDRLFPGDPEQRTLLRELIQRHHEHGSLVELSAGTFLYRGLLAVAVEDPYALDSRQFDQALSALNGVVNRDNPAGGVQPRSCLALLLLHGFADTLAGRGPANVLTPADRAAAYLTYLAAARRRPQIEQAAARRDALAAVTSSARNIALADLLQARQVFGTPRQREVAQHLQRWGLARLAQGIPCPTPQEVVDQAEAFLLRP